MSKKVLVRSSQELINDGYISYGWGKVDFSKYKNIEDLLESIKSIYGGYGRRRKQIQRFFELEKGDIVIVPLHKSIAIGKVIGNKKYISASIGRENVISVEFYKNDEGNILRISRDYLQKNLSSRLRVRMSNINLAGFSQEIDSLIEDISSNKNITINTKMSELNSNIENQFKKTLLSKMQQGKIYIQAGGAGLEQLVVELLEIEGYSNITIESKRKYTGKGDVDIIADKTEFHGEICLAIQVKDYKGQTGLQGLEQIKEAFDNGEAETTAIPMLITLGEVDNIRDRAEELNIKLMDGEAFIYWLYSNINKLSMETRFKLGIFDVPALLE